MYYSSRENGNKHGQGAYTWPDGKKYVGEWENDEFHGFNDNKIKFCYAL